MTAITIARRIPGMAPSTATPMKQTIDNQNSQRVGGCEIARRSHWPANERTGGDRPEGRVSWDKPVRLTARRRAIARKLLGFAWVIAHQVSAMKAA